MLYEMLAATGCFNFVTARHVICYPRLGRPHAAARQREWLNRRFETLGLRNRIVDPVAICADTPEEYGFILDNCGAGFSVTPRNQALFRSMCARIQADHGRPRRLLLKNPWDFGSDRTIRSLLPPARFICIHRNPFHVISSMLRVLDATLTTRNAYLAMLSRRYRTWADRTPLVGVANRLAGDHGIAGRLGDWIRVRCLLAHVRRATNRYLYSACGTAPWRIDIGYEQLCRAPDETVERILDWLGVVKQASGSMSDLIRTSTSDVAEAVRAHRAAIAQSLHAYGKVVGFDMKAIAGGLAPSREGEAGRS